MGKFGRGYLLSPQGTRRIPFGLGATRHLVGAPPPSASLLNYMPPVFDQGQTGSCTGHGTSAALVASYAAAGKPLGFIPSMRGIYDVARQIARPGEPLEDGGADPHAVMVGIREWGFRVMGPHVEGRFSDCSPANVNTGELLTDLQADLKHREIGDYEISVDAAQRSLQVRTALAAGLAIGVGFFVDSAFEDWTSGMAPVGTPNFNDPSGGGHWVCLYGYDASAGSPIYSVRNSWAESWGKSGDFEATDAWLGSAYEIIAFKAG